MKRFKGLFQKPVTIALLFFCMCSSYSFAEQVWEEEGVDLVARITVIEGQLERFDSETQEWIVTVRDAPVGIGDQLFAGAGTRAEILIPNNTILRIGEETEARFVSLTEQLTEINIFSGTARLYNNSSRTDIVATTRFGRIEVPPGASVDLNIDDSAVEIIPLDNSVYFTGNRSSGRHEIIAGSASLVAYSDRIMPAGASVDRSWNAWNQDLDALRAERRRTSGESQDYLPASLNDEAYILNACGSWYRVYYEGDYYRFWRPRYVDIGWSPFSVGMWMTWRGDRVWIPREPFGYVTHHYGNWIYVHGTWYWAPPVSHANIRSGLPLLNIGFCWYPGRVAWIDAGIHIHWTPLAPFEPFYCHYPWGFRTIVITNGPYPRYVASHKFKYRRHTVMGRQDHFYRNKRGSHISKWRYASRSGGHLSPAPRKKERTETRDFRNTSEKKNETRIRGDGKPEEGLNRDRREYSETRVTEGENRHESKKSESNRESIVVTNNGTISVLPEKSRQFNSQSAERRSNQPVRQSRYQSSENTFQRSGSKNRSGSTRSDKNTSRAGNRTYRSR